MKKLVSAFCVLGLAFVGLTAIGCDQIDREVDCHKICDRYSECFDKDFDVSACQKRCSNRAEEDNNFADNVDSCDNCIGKASCVEGAFKCASECKDIVP